MKSQTLKSLSRNKPTQKLNSEVLNSQISKETLAFFSPNSKFDSLKLLNGKKTKDSEYYTPDSMVGQKKWMNHLAKPSDIKRIIEIHNGTVCFYLTH